MAKKVLITGSGGFIGKNVYRLLNSNGYEVFGIGRNFKKFVDAVVDITNEIDFLTILNFFNPDIIIHSAAMSAVDRCEAEKELAFNSNVLPAKILSEWSLKHDAYVVYISTDYVYDGVSGNFNENSNINPVQYYGYTKYLAEKEISRCGNFSILRPTVVYGLDDGGMNFFMQLYRNFLDKKIMKVPVDQVSNPTYVRDLSRLILGVVKCQLNGVFVATGNESLNRYDFAKKICNLMDWNSDFVVPVKTVELGQLARRPLNNSTDSTKICNLLQFKFEDLNSNLLDARSDIYGK